MNPLRWYAGIGAAVGAVGLPIFPIMYHNLYTCPAAPTAHLRKLISRCDTMICDWHGMIGRNTQDYRVWHSNPTRSRTSTRLSQT